MDIDDGLTSNYQILYEASNYEVLTAYSSCVNQNMIQSSSTFIFAPFYEKNAHESLIVITPSAHATAFQLATEISQNSNGLAQASACTAVILKDFSALSEINTLTIGINIEAVNSIAMMNAFSVTPDYTQMAFAINADPHMQAYGVYAIPRPSCVKIYSRHGYDIFVQSHGTATCKMQLLDRASNVCGKQVSLNPGEFVIGVGLISVTVPKYVKFSCGDDALFGCTMPTPTAFVGLFNPPMPNAEELPPLTFINLPNNAMTSGFSGLDSIYTIIQNISHDGTVGFFLSGHNQDNPVGIMASVTNNDFGNLEIDINSFKNFTGIIAEAKGRTLVLNSINGYDIKITNFAHSFAVDFYEVTPEFPVVGNQALSLLSPNCVSIEVLGCQHSKPIKLYSGGACGGLGSIVISQADYTAIYYEIMQLYFGFPKEMIILLKSFFEIQDIAILDKLLSFIVAIKHNTASSSGAFFELYKCLNQQANAIFAGIMTYALASRQCLDDQASSSPQVYQDTSKQYRLYKKEFLPAFNEAVAQKLKPNQFIGFSKDARQVIYQRAANLLLEDPSKLTKQHFKALLF